MTINRNTTAKITLVGAGPGDPELLTIKAWKALKYAKVILFDALINRKLLDLAPIDAIKIDVGKRAGKHRVSQEKINQLLVHYALQYGHVVRLKGGDPFVFGRGFEELQFARRFNVEVEIIPGISSALAVPATQHIPLTCRGISESFWVLTGTTRTEQLSQDIAMAVKTNTTVVILMGMAKLQQICQIYIQNGKAQIPAIAIQSGTTANEKAVLGTAENLHKKVKAAALVTPGIIIIGNVVGLHQDLENGIGNTNYYIKQLTQTL